VSENLDLVRSIYPAWGPGDYSSAEWADPEIEYVHADGPDPGSWKGLAGIADGLRKGLSAWAEFRTEADEYRELDGEHVIVFIRGVGRGKTSGVELDQMQTRGAHLFRIRDGKVTRLVVYFAAHALSPTPALLRRAAPRPRSRFRVGSQSRRADGTRQSYRKGRGPLVPAQAHDTLAYAARSRRVPALS